MKDFNSYSNDQEKTTEDENLVNVIAKALKGKGEGQLLQTIIKQAEQSKKNGTLTNADLDNFYNNLAPLLDGFKKAKLKQIINKLKTL